MRDSIQSDSLYWISSSCGRIELAVPGEAIVDLSASGPIDDAAEYWSARVDWSGVSPEDLARDLSEYGAWDEAELEDEEANRRRFLWTACGGLADSEDPDEDRVIHSVLWSLRRGDGPGHLADMLAAGLAFPEDEASDMLAALESEGGDLAAACRVALAYDDRTGLEGLGYSIRN